MKFELYSIYDVVSEEYGPIFQAKNTAVATRYVKGMLGLDDIKLSDYYLKGIGRFDSDCGSLIACDLGTIRLDHLLNLDSDSNLSDNSVEVVD